MKKNILDYFEEYFCMGMLAFMTVLIFVQVVMRYVFHNSLSWSEELGRYCFIWLSWIGASYCVKIDAHLRVTAVVGLAKGKMLCFINLVMYIFWGVFAGVLAYYGVELVRMICRIGQTSPALMLPMWIPVSSVPVGTTLMTIRIIGKIKACITDLKQ